MEYRILKEASLIETENYPCHYNRAGVETGNNGMSGDSLLSAWIIRHKFSSLSLLSWHSQWWELSLTWSYRRRCSMALNHPAFNDAPIKISHMTSYLQSLFWDNRIIFWVLLISLSVDKSICSPPPPSPFFNKKKSQKIWNKICSSNYYFTVINQ